jgi:hypothetical protein
LKWLRITVDRNGPCSVSNPLAANTKYGKGLLPKQPFTI